MNCHVAFGFFFNFWFVDGCFSVNVFQTRIEVVKCFLFDLFDCLNLEMAKIELQTATLIHSLFYCKSVIAFIRAKCVLLDTELMKTSEID